MPPDDVLAAEWAFGLLDAEERREVDARRLRDDVFARRCDVWAEHAALLLRSEDVPPPADAWQRIASRLPANDMAERQRLRLSRGRWRALALSMTAVALALGASTYSSHFRHPLPVTSSRQHPAPVVVVLTGDKNAVIVSVAIDRTTGLVTAATKDLTLDGRSAQLWLIAPGGSPRSLGLLPSQRSALGGSFYAPILSLGAGTTLAVSLEPSGGSKTGKPTGPVVASGSV